jgi:SAM-dependent methyltransferase
VRWAKTQGCLFGTGQIPGAVASPTLPRYDLPAMIIKTRDVAFVALWLGLCLFPGETVAQTPFEPSVGQPGKDVVWVPTPPELVEKMLDMAKVTPRDFVIDLGSGDGRNVIAAAKRGARSLGVEFNPDMVALSRRLAKEAGVSDKANFVEGDMYAADISKATVLALFLLPSNLDQLQAKFLALKPGTRIVLNTFGIDGWDPDATETVGSPCTSWCNALLLIVPAKVAGTWDFGDFELALSQQYQKISGTLTGPGGYTEISSGLLQGDQISFFVGKTEYTGRVDGNRIEGSATTDGRKQDWTARRR